MKKLFSSLIILSILVSGVSAHGGRLNSEGCHNDYEEGTYHCHDEDGNIISSTNLEEKNETRTEKQEEMKAKKEEVLENKEEREEYRETMKELRSEAKEMREERKAARQEFVAAAKANLTARIEAKGARLSQIPQDKLSNAAERIEEMIVKYEENEKLSDEIKDVILDQLYALQEMIEVEIDEDKIGEIIGE